MNDGKIIIDKIIAEAEEAAKSILDKAQKEADEILRIAQDKADKEADVFDRYAEDEAGKARAKEISGAEMQAKKAVLEKKQGRTTARPDAKLCNGNCTECAITDDGCWTLGPGEQVVFNEH